MAAVPLPGSRSASHLKEDCAGHSERRRATASGGRTLAAVGGQGARIRRRREDAAATTDGLCGPMMGSLGFFLFFD